MRTLAKSYTCGVDLPAPKNLRECTKEFQIAQANFQIACMINDGWKLGDLVRVVCPPEYEVPDELYTLIAVPPYRGWLLQSVKNGHCMGFHDKRIQYVPVRKSRKK